MAKAIPFKVWATNELLTIADLNQVSENANPQTDYGIVANNSLSFNFITGATWSVVLVQAHVTRTGRVKITAMVSSENTTGALIGVEHNLFWDTINPPAISITGSATDGLAAQYYPNGQEQFATIVHVKAGLTPNTNYVFGYGARRISGAGSITMKSYTLMVEDI